MDAPEGDTPPPTPPTCVADPYYSCGPTCDPYWENVVLQAHFDGTDGSTTFTDSSINPKTITRYLLGSQFPLPPVELYFPIKISEPELSILPVEIFVKLANIPLRNTESFVLSLTSATWTH